MPDSQTELFYVTYATARDTIHAAKRAGSPLKPEQVSQENFVLALGFLQGLAGQYGRQQQAAGELMAKMGGLVDNMLGPDYDAD